MRAMLARKNRIEQATSLILDLQRIHKLKDSRIDPLQPDILQYTAEIEILQYIAAHPNSTAYNIARKKVLRIDRDGKYRDERWIRRRLSDLEDKGLIERTQKAFSQHKAKPSKLTISGLIYLILQREIIYNDVIRGILKYYSSNLLFQLFVYPYVKQDTLQRLTSFNSLSPLSSYLYECCRGLEDAVHTINQTKSKHVTEGYLVWQSVPDDNHATSRLREFLRRELNMEWIAYARFEKSMNDNTLRVSTKANSVLIELNETRTKAILTMKGKKIFELTVREYVKESENSKGCFVIEIPSKMTTNEGAANFLIGYTQSHVPSFVFNLMLNVTAASDDFRILSQDRTFSDTLEKTKMKFDGKYEVLANLKNASASFS